jgi:hypothetical protein
MTQCPSQVTVSLNVDRISEAKCQSVDLCLDRCNQNYSFERGTEAVVRISTKFLGHLFLINDHRGCFTYHYSSPFGSDCRKTSASLHARKHISLTVPTDLSIDVNTLLHLLTVVVVS